VEKAVNFYAACCGAASTLFCLYGLLLPQSEQLQLLRLQGRCRSSRVDKKITSSRVRTLPKNLIRPLPPQDLKDDEFWRPALPIADACRRSDEENYDGDTAVSRDENLTCVGMSLALAVKRLI
jgi:hypothetical protein